MYSVNFWCSNPEEQNDDCTTGVDFSTFAEAESFYNDPFTNPDFARHFQRCTAFIEMDGPDVNKNRSNPDYKPSKNDDDWGREIAMQAGMMGGCNAFNDSYGY